MFATPLAQWNTFSSGFSIVKSEAARFFVPKANYARHLTLPAHRQPNRQLEVAAERWHGSHYLYSAVVQLRGGGRACIRFTQPGAHTTQRLRPTTVNALCNQLAVLDV